MNWQTLPDAPENVRHWSGEDPSDAGSCDVCGNSLDEGRCTCRHCFDCDDNIEEQDGNVQITVEHYRTKKLGKVWVCETCAEMREWLSAILNPPLQLTWTGNNQ